MKNNVIRTTTIFLSEDFNPFLEIIHHSGQYWLIYPEHFLSNGILQIVQIAEFYECTHASSDISMERNHIMTIQESAGVITHHQNLKPENIFLRILIDAVLTEAPSS